MNGNGKEIKEQQKQIDEQLEKNVEKYKEFITKGTVLVVRLNEQGVPQWTSSLPPPDLNILLDRMKFNIVNPQPPKKQKNIITDIKGAFGKKRF
jgi:hypothetical protein